MKKNKLYKDNVNKRINIYILVVVCLFTVIIVRLTHLTIFEEKKYTKKLNDLSQKTILLNQAPRGRIYDRNYNIIVDNKAVKTIYYKKDKKISRNDEINLAYLIVKHINIDTSKLTDDMKKDFYIDKYQDIVDKKITKKERKDLEERKLSIKDIEKLKKERITYDEINSLTDIDKKAAYLYYLMNSDYNYKEKIIKNKDVTDEEYSYISLNKDKLKGFNTRLDWERTYPYNDTFKSILGNISSDGIPKELSKTYLKKGYSLDDRVGISFIEKEYESYLKGTKDKYELINSHDLKLIEKGKRGNDIVLSIDINLQREIENILSEEVVKAKSEANTNYYDHSFVMIEDPKTGEVLAMAGKKVEKVNNKWEVSDYTPQILTSPMTPGSVVKAASMLVGYNNGAIKIGDKMIDECVKIASTPKKCSWRNLGYINDIDALALSSNVYQFKTAMKVAGTSYQYNMPFKIHNDAFTKYRNMYHSFGLGVKTGIDLPVESMGYTSKDETPGLLLDFVMGQFETYTPVQLSQYIATLANNGTRLKPHLLKEVHETTESNNLGELIKKIEPEVLNKIDTKDEYLNRVKEGLHAVCMSNYGLGRNYIDSKYDPSGKTGTSQSFLDTDNDGKIDTETISTVFIGYAPTNEPKMSIVVTSPDSSHPNSNINYNSLVNLHITKKVSNKYFELYP